MIAIFNIVILCQISKINTLPIKLSDNCKPFIKCSHHLPSFTLKLPQTPNPYGQIIIVNKIYNSYLHVKSGAVCPQAVELS